MSDYAMLALETGVNAIDWSILVEAESNSNGTLFFSSPAISDAIQMIPDPVALTVDINLNHNLHVGSNLTIVDEADIGDLTVASLNTSLCVDASGGSKLGRCTSSSKYKDHIGNLSIGLKEIMQLRPISFEWKNNGLKDLGFVAEEEARVDPVLATYDQKGRQPAGVKYRRLTAALTRTIQEMKAIIDEQGRQIES